jgi:hypothetical protein
VTNEPLEIDDESGAPDQICAVCGHRGDEHIVQEVETAGTTERSIYCTECENWHSFVPAPEV